MTFPIDNPLFQILYWVLNTPGVGALFVALIAAGLILGYGMVLRWISAAGKDADFLVYSYPTPGLHDHGKSSEKK